MSTIIKEFKYHRSENYGGGDIKITASYQSTADWVTISIKNETIGLPDETFGLPLEEWQYMFDLINKALAPKEQSIH